MAGELIGRLVAAVNAFNAATPNGTYEDLRPFLDPNVVMHLVNDPNRPPKTTSDGVIRYLKNDQGSKLPKLYDPNSTQFKANDALQTPYPIGNSPTGEVTGTGTYIDDSVRDPGNTTRVRYHFAFRIDANRVWVITDALATPT
jgi:hypothetical protein